MENHIMKTAIQALIILALAGSQLYGGPNESPPPIPSEEEPEVLNEGPIHEAFAQPVALDSQAGIVSPNEPMAAIAERPASERPKGSQYVWIPGYWAWDTTRNDYVWVSGCWRVPPANMSWMPGYWNKVPQGWQWVPGFWIPTARAGQIEYLPQPPEIVDIEPPVVTGVSYGIWVPPCYYWHDGRYILRSGYWLVPRGDWVWIPSHYAWTPHGYVFVSGYWDRVLTSRGLLYAPVYFPRHYYRRPGFTYSLGVIVNVGNLELSLFSYPHYCHYYFGDYYGDFYIGLGIYPWFEFETHHFWYDPIFVHHRWHYRRTSPHWEEHVRQEYDLRRGDSSLRPPRTYRELEARSSEASVRQRSDLRMVEPVQSYAKSKNAPFKFSRMNDKQRDGIVSRTNEINNFRRERMYVESGQRLPEASGRQGESRSREQTTSESRSRAPGGAIEQTKPGERSESLPKESAGSGSSTKRTDMPRSPVTGRDSQGLFRKSTPSRPEREERFERGGSRSSSRGRGGRR
jgi:hypothetical protein